MPTLRAAVKREAAQKGLFDDDVYACNKIAPWVKTVAVAVANGASANLPPPPGETTDPNLQKRRRSYRSVLRRIVQGYNDARKGPDRQAQVAIPKKLMIKKHQLDLAFAVTDYKVNDRIASNRHACLTLALLSA